MQDFQLLNKNMETSKKIQDKIMHLHEDLPIAYVTDGFFAKPLGEDYHIKVCYAEIIWIEAISNYSYIHMRNSKIMSLSYNIGKIEKLLPCKIFVRVSRSEIINIHFVDKYCGNMVGIAGHSFTVSPSHRAYVFSCFNELKRDD